MADELHIKHWLDLSLADGIGPKLVAKLLAHFESPLAVLSAPRRELERVVSHTAAAAIRDSRRQKEVSRVLAWAADNDCKIITLADSAYPPMLLETPSPPPLLFARGNLSLLQKSLVAVVGSRNASPPGVQNAHLFAEALSNHGVGVVSGLAQGVDTAAHEGALAGRAGTVAVIGTGIDIIYPKSNRAMAARIVENGLLLSEFPLGTGPHPTNFPRRNRIISGITRACLVVEASLKSGSLITAQYAAEQGREVFAVPGSINAPMHRGCHRLIRQGAHLTENVFDILEELNIKVSADAAATAARPAAAKPAVAVSPETQAILKNIGFEPTSLDDIASRCNMDAETLLPCLLDLEMDGYIVSVAGGRYQRQ